MASRHFITCHALDTTCGKPAANVKVELLLDEPTLASDVSTLTATTNSDGRVAQWSADPEEIVTKLAAQHSGERLRWRLKFYTEEYYGAGNTFFPFVEIAFYTDLAKSHFHVPLLLGPWSYTTYRGS